MRRIYFFFILLFYSDFLFADAGPKIRHELYMFFYDHDKLIDTCSYKILILEKNNHAFDTVNNRKSTADYWQKTTLRESGGIYYLNLKNVKPFKIQISYEGKVIESGIITPNERNYLYKFDVENNRLKDISPIFYCSGSVYFIALVITLLTETAWGLLIFRIKKKSFVNISKPKFVAVLLVINIISHPLLWYISSHSSVNIIIPEIIIFSFEAVLLYLLLKIKFGKAAGLSFGINCFSFIVGGIIKYMLIEILDIF